MEKTKVQMALMNYKNLVPDEKQFILMQKLEQADDSAYDNLTMIKTHDPILILVMSLFLGGLGIDRFMIGDIGLGVCKLLFGWLTFGIWPLIDMFLCYKKSKEINFNNIISILEKK